MDYNKCSTRKISWKGNDLVADQPYSLPVIALYCSNITIQHAKNHHQNHILLVYFYFFFLFCKRYVFNFLLHQVHSRGPRIRTFETLTYLKNHYVGSIPFKGKGSNTKSQCLSIQQLFIFTIIVIIIYLVDLKNKNVILLSEKYLIYLSI